MKKLLILTSLFVATHCFGQAAVNLGTINLTADQVNGMTWHWQIYTNQMWLASLDPGNVPPVVNAPLNKAQWFISESTNLVFRAIDRKTAIFNQDQAARLKGIWETNTLKRLQIEAILIAP
jgi:hypothetical protein